jgi:polysaccharide biosynthesis/export protein
MHRIRFHATNAVLCSVAAMFVLATPLRATAQTGTKTSEGVAAANRSAAAQPSTALPELPIEAGDLLLVEVYGAPEYTQQLRVDTRGYIPLPMAGGIKVAGLTVPQAKRVIAQHLKDSGVFKDPDVSLVQQEYATQGVTVVGEVQKPGIYSLLAPRMLHDVISLAGGTTQNAGRVVTITHRGDSEPSRIVQLGETREGESQAPVEILPGDTVVVSKAGLIYVIGDVAEPSGFMLQGSDITVLQAVALAKGTNRTAALDSARVIRKRADGREEVPVPLKKILSGQVPDVTMQADDILFVPTSQGKSAMFKTLDAIVRAATGVAIRESR